MGTLKEMDDGGHATDERTKGEREKKEDGGHVEGDGRWRTRDGEEGGEKKDCGHVEGDGRWRTRDGEEGGRGREGGATADTLTRWTRRERDK